MNLQSWLNGVKQRLPAHPNAQTRLFFLIVGTVVVLLLSQWLTGDFIPPDNQEANIFQGGILLVIFGSLFLEDKFTKPADAVVNAIAAIISLIPVSNSFGTTGWLVVAYCFLVGLVGTVNLAFGQNRPSDSWAVRLKGTTYHVSTVFGKSNIIFSIIFLYAVFSFYGVNERETGVLVLFWGIYIALWPLKIPHIVQALFSTENLSLEKGVVIRVDSPNLVRVQLHRNAQWSGNMVACLGDGGKRNVLPLYTQVQDNRVIGTGLLLEEADFEQHRTRTGGVYEASTVGDEWQEPVGFIVEGSQIAKIYFETWRSDDLSEGLLAFCDVRGERIYYQIIDAATAEELFERHKHGFQVVEAHQLGILDPERGFKKFTWVPEMNAPVYLAKRDVQEAPRQLPSSQMCFGTVPGTNVEVVCDINEMISHHTAILGVTGSGKTELAYTIIHKAIENGVKVVCVDITGMYTGRLNVLGPVELSISADWADELGERLFEVETGKYRGQEEKKALRELDAQLRTEVDTKVKDFLTGDNSLGIFTLPSISNTKATVHITELYLSAIFNYARDHVKENINRVLIVLEEAHTVIPEATTMGLGDWDSKGMVAKIAQIALQGRKYNVGLLVVAQRTATVSKTVLTQCNTIITFASFDQTGLNFLSNIYGAEHTAKISNLPFLHALAFGKGIKSERPIVVEIPFNPGLETPTPSVAEAEDLPF